MVAIENLVVKYSCSPRRELNSPNNANATSSKTGGNILLGAL